MGFFDDGLELPAVVDALHKELLSDINDKLRSERFSDVHFVCDDGSKVSANRAFLAARCPYFESMLYGSLKESSLSEIPLPGVSGPALRFIVEALYSGDVSSLKANTIGVEAYNLAKMYGLQTLCTAVYLRLKEELNLETVGHVLSAAVLLQVEELQQLVLTVFNNSSLPSALEGFSDLAVMWLVSEANGLQVKEEQLLVAVVAWATDCISTKEAASKCARLESSSTPSGQKTLKSLLQPLLKHMQLEHVPTTVVQQLVEGNSLLDAAELGLIYKTQAIAAGCSSGFKSAHAAYRRLVFDVDSLAPALELSFSEGREMVRLTHGFSAHHLARGQLCFSEGIHAWEYHVKYDSHALTWVGAVDSSAQRGNDSGVQGLLVGSNDQLIQGTTIIGDCGLGCWGQGSRVLVVVDMDRKRMFVRLQPPMGQASELKRAFSGLPASVHPAVFLTERAQVEMRYLQVDADTANKVQLL